MTKRNNHLKDALDLARVFDWCQTFASLTDVAKATDVMKETEKVNDEKVLTVPSKNDLSVQLI